MFEKAMNIFIHGLAFGGMISTLAVGFSLIFGVAKIVNMAHTAFYMIASFFIFTAITKLHVPLLLSSALSVVFTSLLAIVCYKLCFDRVKEHETAVMIISIALAMLFQEILLLIFGGQYYGIPPFFPGYMEVSGIRISYKYIVAFATSFVALGCLWYWLTKTRLGNAIRSVAQDREIANIVGIDVSRICMIITAISAALASVAGAVVAPIYSVHPLMWVPPLVMVLAAVVLGGLGSIKGSVIAAFILGFAETSVIFLIPDGSFLRGAVSLAIMVVVLVIRPEGLYGVVFEEERL